MHAFIQETELKFSLSISIYTIVQCFSSEKSFKLVLHAQCAKRINASIYYSVIAVQKGVDLRL